MPKVDVCQRQMEFFVLVDCWNLHTVLFYQFWINKLVDLFLTIWKFFQLVFINVLFEFYKSLEASDKYEIGWLVHVESFECAGSFWTVAPVIVWCLSLFGTVLFFCPYWSDNTEQWHAPNYATHCAKRFWLASSVNVQEWWEKFVDTLTTLQFHIKSYSSRKAVFGGGKIFGGKIFGKLVLHRLARLLGFVVYTNTILALTIDFSSYKTIVRFFREVMHSENHVDLLLLVLFGQKRQLLSMWT